MLASFSVENFRSIDSKITLSMSASTSIKENVLGGVVKYGNSSLLTSIAIYGSNSSGKSNLLKAMLVMGYIVRHSVRLNDDEELPYEPFALSLCKPRPTSFEISFFDDKDLFTYLFKYDSKEIKYEVLTVKSPRKSLKTLFTRTESDIELDPSIFPEGKVVKENGSLLNKNRLLLSLCGQLKGEYSNRVISWFNKSFLIVSGAEGSRFAQQTRKRMKDDPDFKSKVLSFLGDLDLGFKGVKIAPLNYDELSSSIPAEVIAELKKQQYLNMKSIHNVYDDSGITVGERDFDFEEFESDGTNKLISLAGPIVQALEDGITLCVDELDSQLHPLLTRHIVRFFMQNNPNNAQLIFSTHDTSLLAQRIELLRRDQVALISKDQKEKSSLAMLKDIVLESGHKPRNDSNMEKTYLEGKYNAIPDIQDLFRIDSNL